MKLQFVWSCYLFSMSDTYYPATATPIDSWMINMEKIAIIGTWIYFWCFNLRHEELAGIESNVGRVPGRPLAIVRCLA